MYHVLFIFQGKKPYSVATWQDRFISKLNKKVKYTQLKTKTNTSSAFSCLYMHMEDDFPSIWHDISYYVTLFPQHYLEFNRAQDVLWDHVLWKTRCACTIIKPGSNSSTSLETIYCNSYNVLYNLIDYSYYSCEIGAVF